jgi:hypothetical protein
MHEGVLTRQPKFLKVFFAEGGDEVDYLFGAFAALRLEVSASFGEVCL